jgi:2-polyprenyl-6-methoxyphenol hydroxylase-like FAD-dependent oxidoreductase
MRRVISHQGRRAVVIGGSMAGLSAAAVLAPRFGEVVIVDRDDLGGGPQDRRGVPQGRHAHALLPAGHQRIEGWFPGFTEDLVADGAREVDLGDGVLWFLGDAARISFRSGILAPVSSRSLLEHHVRRRVLALPNVSLLSGAGASGLTWDADGRSVTGITLEDGTVLDADLVVDASGRAGRTVPWVSALGYEEPSISAVTIDMGYASRVFRRSPGSDMGTDIVFLNNGPPTGRQGLVFPLEGDRWLVTLAGFHGDHPPRDPEGFLDFARSLPLPAVAEIIESSEPLGAIVTHRMPSNQRRHVERLGRVPGGLVMLGDAVCSFNPVYGQGMSSAILQAEALGMVLDSVATVDERFVRRFYRRLAKVVSPIWQMSTGADFALPETRGPKAPGTDLVNRYMAKVMQAAQVSEDVCRRLLEVTALLRPARDLLTPAMVVKVRRAARLAAPASAGGSVAPQPLDAGELQIAA